MTIAKQDRLPLTREFLVEQIVVLRKSRRQIADETGWSVGQINKKTREFDIKEDTRKGRPSWNAGRRDPSAKRNREKAEWWGREHREKLAAAKRGKVGPDSNRWKGGRLIGGYVVVNVDGKKQYLHRLIAEDLLGRNLSGREQVHHMDHDRKNNVPSNLIVLMEDDHARLHGVLNTAPAIDQIGWLRNNNIWFVYLGDIDGADSVHRSAA